MDGGKVKAGPKKKSKANFCDDKKKSLAKSDKGSWHDQPKEETDKTQAGTSRVKIARLNAKDKFKMEPVPSKVKTSQILMIQDRLPKTIMLPPSSSAFFSFPRF